MDAHEIGYFTEENSVEVVTGRNRNAKDERLKFIMEVVTRKLHEAIKEIEPTEKEWFDAIMFLTKTGHMCDEWRQEYILLSDVLGVSMLVEMINQAGAVGTTEPTVFGPFHVEGAPERAGTYDMTITAEGYETLRQNGISVRENECHVETRTLTAELTPIPLD